MKVGGSSQVSRAVWCAGEVSQGVDAVATETAIAMVYNGISHVVMMATPADLEDFALGFSLSEGIVNSPKQMLDFEQIDKEQGIELAITITAEPFVALKQRRRNLVGRTGCGLCGAESLEQAISAPKSIDAEITVSHQALQRAIGALKSHQALQQSTGAVHGAAWCNSDGEILLLREDVGRHNALDKLLGAIGKQPPAVGFALVTSRASYEMVSKTASANIPLLVAVSAPTSLAIELAEQSGLTLVGFSRLGRHVIYANGFRLK